MMYYWRVQVTFVVIAVIVLAGKLQHARAADLLRDSEQAVVAVASGPAQDRMGMLGSSVKHYKARWRKEYTLKNALQLLAGYPCWKAHAAQQQPGSMKRARQGKIKRKQERTTSPTAALTRALEDVMKVSDRKSARHAAHAARKAAKQLKRHEVPPASQATTRAHPSNQQKKPSNNSDTESINTASEASAELQQVHPQSYESPSMGEVYGMSKQAAACSQGQISQIKCWLDADGYITGVAFENENGITTPALCDHKSKVTDGGSLEEGESIVDVVSCRGRTGAISYLEFHTDGNSKQPITCGRGFTSKDDDTQASLGTTHCVSLTQGQPSKKGISRDQRSGIRAAGAGRGVYPLIGLRGSCSSQHQLEDLWNQCWDDSYDKEAPVGRSKSAILIEGHVDFEDTLDDISAHPHRHWSCHEAVCEDDHTSKKVSAWLGAALKKTMQLTGVKQDMWFRHAITKCKPCSSEHGTTIKFAAMMNFEEGSAEEQEHSAQHLQDWLDMDVCGVSSMDKVCADMGVAELRFGQCLEVA